MIDVVEESRGKWRDILTHFGINPSFLTNTHGPCPICGGKDRFRFDDQLNGRWICNRCGSGDGFQLLAKVHGWAFREACGKIREILVECHHDSEAKTPVEKSAILNRWKEESHILQAGDLGHSYLVSRCGKLAPETLRSFRMHPSLHYDGAPYPTLLALLRDEMLKPVGMQRIFLSADGRKVGKKTFGSVGAGCQLGKIGSPRIVVGEGIETVLCACKLLGIPGWAALSASCLRKWNPPSDAQEIVIAADNDSNFVGQAAAFALAERLVLAKYSVTVALPEKPNSDFADVYKEREASGQTHL